MAGNSENLNIDITAKDQASKVIDPIVKKVEKLEKEDVEIPISADAKTAGRDIDTFIKKLDGLKDRDAAILIAAKVAPAQAALADLLTDISQLDASDPSIDVKMNQVTEITGDLEKLDAKLQALDSEVISPKVDTSNIRKAGDDARTTADTFQTGVGPLRGLTDEMGAAGVAAGTMGNALIDGGEAIQVFGAKLGLSESALAKVSGGFAILGAAVAVGMIAYQSFIRQQEETKKKTAEATASLLDQSGAIEDLRGQLDPTARAADAFASALGNEDFKRSAVAIGALGHGIGELGDVLEGIREPGNAFLKNMLEGAGVSSEWSGIIAKAINEGDSYKDVINGVASALEDQGMDAIDAQAAAVKLTAQYSRQINALEELNDQAENNNLEKIAQDQLDAAAAGDNLTKALLAEAQAATQGGTAVDTYNKFLELSAADAKASADAHRALVDSIAVHAAEAGVAASNSETLTAAIDGVNSALDEQVAALEETEQGYRDAQAAQEEMIDSALNAADSGRDAADKFRDLGEVLKDHKKTSEEVTDATIAFAKAQEKAKDDSAAASGEIRTNTEKVDSLNDSLLGTAAASKTGRAEIVGYIGELNGIPPEKQTEIIAALDRGDVAEAKRILDEASATRTVAIGADTSKFDGDVAQSKAEAAKPVTVVIKYREDQRYGPHAKGGTVGPAGGLAGEAGPEFVQLPGRPTVLIDSPMIVPPRTRVTSVRKTRAILSRRTPRYANGTTTPAVTPAGAMSFTFNQQAPIYGVSDLDQHLARWSQRLAQQISAGKR